MTKSLYPCTFSLSKFYLDVQERKKRPPRSLFSFLQPQARFKQTQSCKQPHISSCKALFTTKFCPMNPISPSNRYTTRIFNHINSIFRHPVPNRPYHFPPIRTDDLKARLRNRESSLHYYPLHRLHRANDYHMNQHNKF